MAKKQQEKNILDEMRLLWFIDVLANLIVPFELPQQNYVKVESSVEATKKQQIL